jgi:hypothetical protein
VVREAAQIERCQTAPAANNRTHVSAVVSLHAGQVQRSDASETGQHLRKATHANDVGFMLIVIIMISLTTAQWWQSLP